MYAMSSTIKSVTVFCGSRSGKDPRWELIARQCGEGLAQRGLALVFGGGCCGLMGAIAQAVIEGPSGRIKGLPQTLR